MKQGEPPIIVEQSFAASIDTVWRAITEVDQMRQWYFSNILAFRAEVGFETRFEVTNQGRVFPYRWKVTKVVPLKTLEYNWQYDGYSGESLVAFELFEQNGLTALSLTARVVESFPEGIPEFTRESGIGGWTYFITQSLKTFLTET
jgi:uncharacterized protein YndB with AHSA1/START domain